MSRDRFAVIVVITALFVLSSVFAHASMKNDIPSGACELPALQIDRRPGLSIRPTQVHVGLQLINVTGIEDTSQSISADFFLSQTWTDPRLKDFEGCQFGLDEIWTPQIDIANSGRLFTRLPKQAEVFESGQVRLVQRYRGPLVFKYDAHRFPFDQQDIRITLFSIEYDKNDVILIIDESKTGRHSEKFDVADWTISDVTASIISKHLDIFSTDHSAFEFKITAERRSGYYIWKVIVPLMLIVLMSWTVFWIDPTQSGTQIGMSATSMLTLIAFQFAMANILPHLSYYTVLDKFIAGATVFVFLALIESVTTSHLISNKKVSTAMRIDRIFRWVFPTSFLIFTLVVFPK